jgi:hypothetical protein
VVVPTTGKTVWPQVLPTFECGRWKESTEAREERAGIDTHEPDCVCLRCLCAAQDASKWKTMPDRIKAEIRRIYPDLANRMESL